MFRIFFLGLLSLIPQISFAVETPTTFRNLVYFILDYINLLIPLFVILSLGVFFWGLVRFIARVGGNEEEIKNGKNLIIYGLIGFFVMASLWAIVSLISDEFNFGDLFIPQLPEGFIRGVDDVPLGDFPTV